MHVKASHASIVLVAALLGVTFGLGAYTFAYAKGWSYVTDNSAACANCHIMNEQYDGWTKSSHRSVAVCNDCHVPARLPGQVRHEGPQRVLALVLLHDRRLPGTDPRDAQEPRHRRGQLPPLPRAGGGGDGHTCTRRIARHLVRALSWIGRPHGARRDQRCRRREVNT